MDPIFGVIASQAIPFISGLFNRGSRKRARRAQEAAIREAQRQAAARAERYKEESSKVRLNHKTALNAINEKYNPLLEPYLQELAQMRNEPEAYNQRMADMFKGSDMFKDYKKEEKETLDSFKRKSRGAGRPIEAIGRDSDNISAALMNKFKNQYMDRYEDNLRFRANRAASQKQQEWSNATSEANQLLAGLANEYNMSSEQVAEAIDFSGLMNEINNSKNLHRGQENQALLDSIVNIGKAATGYQSPEEQLQEHLYERAFGFKPKKPKSLFGSYGKGQGINEWTKGAMNQQKVING